MTDQAFSASETPWTLSVHCPKPNSCTRHGRCTYMDKSGDAFVPSCVGAAERMAAKLRERTPAVREAEARYRAAAYVSQSDLDVEVVPVDVLRARAAARPETVKPTTSQTPAAKLGRVFDLLSRRDPTLNGTLYEDAEFAALVRDLYAALAAAARAATPTEETTR